MNRYEIRCTEEQTMKAFELGAPVEKDYSTTRHDASRTTYINDGYYCIPTAEQMIGFLRSKGIKFHFNDATNYWRFSKNSKIISYGWCEQKELAAIDAALEYLEKQKEID